MPARTTQYLRVLISCLLSAVLLIFLFCRTMELLGLKGISTMQSRQHNCSGSHMSQALWLTISDYKKKYIISLKIRAQLFLKVKCTAQLSLGKELGGLSLYLFLLSYHKQLLKVWSIAGTWLLLLPVYSIPIKLVWDKPACEHSVR